MPLYFLHLTFGERLFPDDEGVELPDRAAACKEARAVVADLTSPRGEPDPRRRAGWFLQLADEDGPFLRLPLGHPALELVPKPGEAPVPAASSVDSAPSRSARQDIAAQSATLSDDRKQLIARSHQLQQELATQLQEAVRLRVRSLEVLAHARRLGRRP